MFRRRSSNGTEVMSARRTGRPVRFQGNLGRGIGPATVAPHGNSPVERGAQKRSAREGTASRLVNPVGTVGVVAGSEQADFRATRVSNSPALDATPPFDDALGRFFLSKDVGRFGATHV